MTKQILFIDNSTQLSQVERKHPELFKKALLIADYPETYCGLSRLNMRNFKCYTDYISPSEMEDRLLVARELTNSWFSPIKGCLDFEGINLYDASKYALIWFFEDAYTAKIIAGNILKTEKPERIFLFLPDMPVDWTFQNNILTLILLKMAEESGIKVTYLNDIEVGKNASTASGNVLSKAKRSTLLAINRIKKLLTRSSASKLNERVTELVKLLEQSGKDADPKKKILFTVGGQDFINNFGLIRGLNKEKDIVTIPAILYLYDTYEKTRKDCGFSFLLTSDFYDETAKSRIESLLGEAWQEFKCFQRTYSGKYTEIFANEYLDAHFRRFYFTQCYSTAMEVLATKRMLDIVQPSLIVMGLDSQPGQRAKVLLARQRNIPTLSLIHSGIVSNNWIDFASDKIAVWGEAHKKQLLNIGKRQAQIEIVGSRLSEEALAIKKSELLQGKEVRRNQIVITTAAGASSLYRTYREDVKAIFELNQLASQMSEYMWGLKAHPRYDNYDVYESCLTGSQGLKLLDKNEPLHNILPSCCLFVLLNAQTTAFIEALMFDCPSIFVTSGFICRKGSLFDNDLILRVDKLEELKPTIEKILYDSAFRAKLIERQRKFLKDFIGEMDGQAIERTVTLIRKMLTNGSIGAKVDSWRPNETSRSQY